MTGHVPGVVRVPTIQLHATAPDADAVFGYRPLAVEGPDLYSTSIEQFAFGAVRAVAVATFPWPVGGRLTIATVSGGAGFTVGGRVEGGRVEGGRVDGGRVVGGRVVVRGLGVTAAVRGAVVGLSVVKGGAVSVGTAGAASGAGVLVLTVGSGALVPAVPPVVVPHAVSPPDSRSAAPAVMILLVLIGLAFLLCSTASG